MSEKLLKKMRALLKMSREAVNENEAEIAMRQLHKLLAQHNVEMSAIDGPEAEEEVDGDKLDIYIRPWVKAIAVHVAKLYFCQVYLSGGRKGIVVVGTEVNRHFALKMIDNIIHTINLSSQTEANKRWHKGPEWSQFQTSFLNAASLTIAERCRDLIESSMRGELEDETGTAMVLASVYDTHNALTTEFMNKLGLRKGRSTRYQMRDRAGAAAGQEAGRKVQLTRSLQKQNQQKRLS